MDDRSVHNRHSGDAGRRLGPDANDIGQLQRRQQWCEPFDWRPDRRRQRQSVRHDADGGSSGDGTVFEIAKTSAGYASTPTTLVSFNGADGASPYSGVIADANGNLFGTTPARGGVRRRHSVRDRQDLRRGYASTPTTLITFDGTNGDIAFGGLIADANGNLFGTTGYGGAIGDGTVFEIAKTSGGYASTPTILVSFNGADGAGSVCRPDRRC